MKLGKRKRGRRKRGGIKGNGVGVDFNENTLHAGVNFSNKNEIINREKLKEVEKTKVNVVELPEVRGI